AARIAGCGMDMRADAEITNHPRICGAVEGNATGEAEIACTEFAHQWRQDPGNRDLQRLLYRSGKIMVLFAHGLVRPPRPHAEMLDQRRIVMAIMPTAIEKPPVQREGAILVELEDWADQLVAIARPAIGGKAHDLVFALVHLKAEILRKDRVEEAERVREVNRSHFPEAVALPEMHRRGLVLADAVERHHDGALERRGKECRCRMRAMVLGKLHGTVKPHMGAQLRTDGQFVMHETGEIIGEQP